MKDIIHFFTHLFDTSHWPPRWHCGQWSSFDGWMYIISDLLVWGAYFFIPVLIMYYLRYRKRTFMQPLFWLFASFILACGFTHLLDALMFWWPAYRFSALSKLFTAVVSWTTVFGMARVLPKALKFRSPEEYQGEIEERKRAQEELAQRNVQLQRASEKLNKQNQQLEDFAFITAHNLRAPVANLTSLLYLYEESDESEKDVLLEKFSGTVQGLSQTLEQLLAVTKIRSGKSLVKEQVHFGDVLNKVIGNFREDIQTLGARISTEFDMAPAVHTNKVYLENIISNLFGNALKYSSPDRHPEIVLRSLQGPDYTEFSISDNGLGIDLERHAEKIFGLHKTFHEHSEAKGVGLFITKSQVDALGGEIRVNSQAGKGSVFTVKFYK